MRISPPTLAFYRQCTYEEALAIVYHRKLRHCEPAPRRILAIRLHEDADLVAFKFRFHEVTVFQDETALVSTAETRTVEAYIEENNLEDRITRDDLLAVRFWDTDDKQAFEQESGLVEMMV